MSKEKNSTNCCLTTTREQVFIGSLRKCSDSPPSCPGISPVILVPCSQRQVCWWDWTVSSVKAELSHPLCSCSASQWLKRLLWAQKPQASHTNRACFPGRIPALPSVQMWNQVQTGVGRVIFVSRTLTDPAGRELLKGSNWEGRRKSAGVRNRPGWKWETSVKDGKGNTEQTECAKHKN